MTRKKTYAQDSHVEIDFEISGNKTVMKDVYTTPPFRVMRPFYDDKGFCEIMVMNSGPGILEGDRQFERYHSGENTKVQITSQSYEKVHQMIRGDYATRSTEIFVEPGSILILKQLPMIIYKNGDIRQTINVDIQGDGKFIISNVFIAGRTGMGEVFEFKRYSNKIQVVLDEELIYMENNIIEPDKYDPLELGLYEGYDHYLSFSTFNYQNTQTHREEILKIIDRHSEKRGLLSGISTTYRGDLQIRILARTGQDLIECSDEIIEYLEDF